MLFVVLCCFSRLYHQRRISGESWIPVLLAGITLLNPRIMQYDVHVVALPMVLILVRSVTSRSKIGLAVTACVLGLTLADLFGVNFYSGDDVRNMCVLIAVMAVGLDYLAAEARRTSPENSFVLSEVVALPQPAMASAEIYSPDAGR
jgi:branched-subunit amino acid ABC-type transport system permease component